MIVEVFGIEGRRDKSIESAQMGEAGAILAIFTCWRASNFLLKKGDEAFSVTRLGLNDSQEPHDLGFGAIGEGAQCLGDQAEAETSRDGDGGIAQDHHHAGTVLGTDLGSVFIEGDVADVVQAVFDAPVATIEREEALGGGLAFVETGDTVDDFRCLFSGFDFQSGSFDLEDLGHEGKG